MKRNLYIWIILLIGLMNLSIAQGQTTADKVIDNAIRDKETLEQSTQRQNEKQQIDRIQRDSRDYAMERNSKVNRNSDYPIPMGVGTYKIADVEARNNKKFTKEDLEKIEAIREPNTEDTSLYKDLLKQKNTGIFKLINVSRCGDGKVVVANKEDCFWILPDLSYFSFRGAVSYKNRYGDSTWADLKYDNQKLITGFEELNIGLIGEIGNISIDSLSKDSLEAISLRQLPLPKKRSELKQIKDKVEKGIQVNNREFSNQANININQTYLLRSYTYRIKRESGNQEKSEVDVIVAFKIIRSDDNKDLTMIWKQLYKGDTRQL